MVRMAEDETTAPPDTGDDERITFGAADKALAGVLLIGALGLAYICLDVMAGGRITAVLSGRPA